MKKIVLMFMVLLVGACATAPKANEPKFDVNSQVDIHSSEAQDLMRRVNALNYCSLQFDLNTGTMSDYAIFKKNSLYSIKSDNQFVIKSQVNQDIESTSYLGVSIVNTELKLHGLINTYVGSDIEPSQDGTATDEEWRTFWEKSYALDNINWDKFSVSAVVPALNN